ncbi:Fanconi anemia core complex-associated protein 24 [Merluccius polli]|uniref:Fanconi anemia core complex-associated protein 24 n=1 Tax=Merluccius polli TaxID=89951 RepID=A0AA47NQ12_MERPO|nr:Fanconi anemia core complex-associated protein 24 [Merluccius polli]
MEAAAAVTAAPPYGHVIGHEKWRDSALIQHIKGAGVKVAFEKELGVVDFLLPNRSSVLYVSECDIIAGNSYKRKLVRFRNANVANCVQANSSGVQALALAERTRLSEQYFSSLQKFVVFDLGLTLLPVSGQPEASQLISQMVLSEGRDNPFRKRSVARLYEPQLLLLLQQIPGVGGVKASSLLHSFSSLQEICSARLPQLEPLVGQASAQHILSFLHNHLV